MAVPALYSLFIVIVSTLVTLIFRRANTAAEQKMPDSLLNAPAFIFPQIRTCRRHRRSKGLDAPRSGTPFFPPRTPPC
jgi:hypothetical protein